MDGGALYVLCPCRRPVLRVKRAPFDMPSLLDEPLSPVGIWTVDDRGVGGKLTVQDVWRGVRGHQAHVCPVTEADQPALFEVID